MTKLIRSKQGMSLIEIMVALLLFGIGISLAMRTLPESSKATNRSRNITIATAFAQAKIEDLMLLEYNDADLNTGAHSDPANPLESHYQRSWEVIVDSPVKGMKQVDVSVTFPTTSSDSSAVLTTYITSRR